MAHQINIEVRKTSLWDGDGLGGLACVVVDLAPLTGQTQAQAVTSLESPRHKNLDEII
jgi:Mrp family chromosome partitioning ATPase